MTHKRHNHNVKRTNRPNALAMIRTNGSPRIETAMQRALGRVRSMTPAQRRKSLIEAGIITSKGNLTASYR